MEDTLANWSNYPRLRDPSDKVYQSRNSDGTYTEIEQPQAAACVFDYRTGELKAIVGGRYKPTTRKTLNRASGMTMPVGSSIKPLTVYAPAIDLGASPASIAYNMPVPISGWKDSSGKDSWPKNYGGGGYKGPQSFRSALRNSYNTAAAQILMTYVGVSRSVEYLHLMGIPDKNINADPFGLALGSSGLTPVQMAVAFGTIANKGVYQQPLSFSRIVDSNGNVVVDMHQQQDRHQVFKPSTAYLVVDMLKEAVQSGTGTKAKISSQVVAGKTGTNSDSKGVFFAGMTGWYSGSVWIGHDNYKALSSKATGGNAAAPLWQSFMEKIHKAKNLDSREIIDGTPSDYNLVRVTTCGVSGQLATDACYNDVNGYKTITDYWSADSVPTAYCSMHKSVSVCTESGLLATDYCPSYSVETRGIVLIPRGHPLYDSIDAYGDTIRKYLGEFATLKSTNDIANHICQIHDAYTAAQQPSDLQNIVSDASNLVYTAYQLVGSAPDLSNDTRRQINTAISAVQTLLSLSPIDYTSLEGAVSNLRCQLQAAGLMLAGRARLTSDEGRNASVYTFPHTSKEDDSPVMDGRPLLVCCPFAVFSTRKAAYILADEFDNRHSALIAKPRRDAILVFFVKLLHRTVGGKNHRPRCVVALADDVIDRADRHAAHHRFAAQIVNRQQVAGQNILHLFRAVAVEQIAPQRFRQFVGRNHHNRISPFQHALRHAVEQERLAQPRRAIEQHALSACRFKRIGILFANLPDFADVGSLRALSALERNIREDVFVKGFKILRFQSLQTVVVIKPIEHGALQADALLVNRFADISRILAEWAAVDGLQIIRAQAAFHQFPPNIGVHPLHLIFHGRGNPRRLFGRRERLPHAGKQQLLAAGQQFRNCRASPLRLVAPLFFFA